ncbi:MAG: rhodanese-like domain-containing protein [Spirochaetaceae bacterium]
MRLVNDLFKELDSTSFLEALRQEEEPQILDVRTPNEFEEGHIPGAKNFDISHPEFPRWLQRLPRKCPYFVYCRSGARSLTACQLLATLGFERIYNLREGIISCQNELKGRDDEELESGR